jgi:tetratricopeptide (TPR) repeat protein
VTPAIKDLFGKADRLLRAGRWREAQASLKVAVIAVPDWEAGLREAGALALRLQGAKPAIQALRRAICRSPGDPRTWILIARARFSAQCREVANRSVRRAAVLDPARGETWSILAADLVTISGYERSLRYFDRSRRIASLGVRDLQVGVQVCFGLGLLERASALARRILVSVPADPTALAALGRAGHLRRNAAVAWHYVRRVGILKVGDAGTLTALSRAALTTGRLETASIFARRAIVTGTVSGEAYLDLARPLLRLDKVEAANHAIDRAAMIDPAFRLRGRILRLTVTQREFAAVFQRNSVSTPV